MDDDDLRRGRPTTHRAFDVATATVAGYQMVALAARVLAAGLEALGEGAGGELAPAQRQAVALELFRDRKSTRLNSSHGYISYAVFCLKKKQHRTPQRLAHDRAAARDCYG